MDGLIPKLHAIIQCINKKLDYDNTFVSNRTNYLSELEKLDTNYLYVWLSKTSVRRNQYNAFEHLWDANFDSITIVEKPNESNGYKYIFETKIMCGKWLERKYYFNVSIYNKWCCFESSK